MKPSILLIAILATCVAPSFAGENSAHKTPFYRPRSSRRVNHAKPRDVGDAVVVNAASYESGISPGGLATIFGDNLTTVSGIVYAYANPLPDQLADVQVYVSGIPAPIYGIAYAGGQGQISIQVPYAAPTGH